MIFKMEQSGPRKRQSKEQQVTRKRVRVPKSCSFHRWYKKTCPQGCIGLLKLPTTLPSNFTVLLSKKMKNVAPERKIEIAVEEWKKFHIQDQTNFIRGWGFDILPADHPIWSTVAKKIVPWVARPGL
jgi:hypothetical protein